MNKLNNNKAFTLIELIVVIAVLGILVLLAAPRFMGHVEDAKITQIQNDVRVAENTVEIERIDDDDFTEGLIVVEASEMETLRDSGHLFNKGGSVNQDEVFDDKYFEVDDELINTELNDDFIMSQGGKVFYYDEAFSFSNGENKTPDYTEYIVSDDDFEWVLDSNGYESRDGEVGYFKYMGQGQKIIEIPHTIKGVEMTSYYYMFDGTGEDVEKIISTNENIEDMDRMFRGSQAVELDLSNFHTSSVTNMNAMFIYSQATNLDLSSFDTSKVTNMNSMFYNSRATELDLSSFDTSSVTSSISMFRLSKATSGLARTQSDADRFNRSSYIPSGLTFKPK